MAGVGYRLKVEGEAEFNAALKDINNNIKLNKAELKLLTEEYNANGKSAETLAEKNEKLQELIGEQTKKIESMKTMYDHAAESIDKNDAGMIRLATSIAKEQAELIKLNAEFEGHKNTLDASASGIDEYESKLERLNRAYEQNKADIELAAAATNGAKAATNDAKAATSAHTAAVETQQKKLETLKNALKAAEAAYGTGSKQADAYRLEITKTETELNKLNNTAQETGKGIGESFSGLQDIIGNLGGGVLNLAGNFELAAGAAGLVVMAIKGGVDKMSEMQTAVENYMDDMNTLSAVSGLSTEELQEWDYMADLIDVDLNTITSSITRLTRNMYEAKNGSSELQKEFNGLDVQIQNGDGTLRGANEVFLELIEALKGIESPTERDAVAMKLMGKSAQELNPLIQANTQDLDALRQMAHDSGFVLSETANDIISLSKDLKDESGANWRAFTNSVGVAWASLKGFFKGTNTFLEMNDMTQNMVDSFWNWLPSFKNAYFKSGTAYAPEGLSVVGEMGPEIIRKPGAGYSVVGKEGPEVVWLEGGERIWPRGQIPQELLAALHMYAAGTASAIPGAAIVGERGPEIIRAGASALPARGGTTNNYYVNIDAKNVREFNDIVRIAETKKQAIRMGYSGR